MSEHDDPGEPTPGEPLIGSGNAGPDEIVDASDGSDGSPGSDVTDPPRGAAAEPTWAASVDSRSPSAPPGDLDAASVGSPVPPPGEPPGPTPPNPWAPEARASAPEEQGPSVPPEPPATTPTWSASGFDAPAVSDAPTLPYGWTPARAVEPLVVPQPGAGAVPPPVPPLPSTALAA